MFISCKIIQILGENTTVLAVYRSCAQIKDPPNQKFKKLEYIIITHHLLRIVRCVNEEEKLPNAVHVLHD